MQKADLIGVFEGADTSVLQLIDKVPNRIAIVFTRDKSTYVLIGKPSL
ncbi:MAG: hypothetical protein AAF509_17930 [Pseudomonadota bacterium]